MSEDNDDFKLIGNKPRSKKLNPRIDLTAMVSIAILLIIFFMVRAELARPQTMTLGVPERSCVPNDGTIYCGCIGSDRTITLLLDGNNKIISYRGLLERPDTKPKKLGYGENGIRKELTRINKQIIQATGTNEKGAIVIIKPSKKSSYGNLVDILDEMAITKIGTYAIVNDYTPEEEKLLASL